MLLLPGAIVGLILLHLYLVIRLGVSRRRGGRGGGPGAAEPQPPASRALVSPRPRGGRSRSEQRAGRAQSALQAVQGGRREAREVVLPVRDVPRHGDEPRRRVGDRRACLRLVRDGRRHGAGRRVGPGWLGVLYAEKADPGTTSFIPRPDWYFYFLFYLLRIFKWPDTVVLATVGIPTILMMLLFALPFIDRRPERRLSRRPVAIVAAILVAGVDGRPHLEGRDAPRESRRAPTLARDSRRTTCRTRRWPVRSSSRSRAA